MLDEAGVDVSKVEMVKMTNPAIADMMDADLVADLYDGDTLTWPAK